MYTFNDTTPAAPSGSKNIAWQTDGTNVSGYTDDPTAILPNNVDLTAQNAAISATTLFTPSVAGFYRIAFYLKVTTPDGASSTLGDVIITFDDGTDTVAQSVIAALADESGASATTNVGNLTTSILQGEMIVWADSGSPVQYAVGYASGTPSTMEYELHIRSEVL